MTERARWFLLGGLLAFTWSNIFDHDWIGVGVTGAGSIAMLVTVGAFSRRPKNAKTAAQPEG